MGKVLGVESAAMTRTNLLNLVAVGGVAVPVLSWVVLSAAATYNIVLPPYLALAVGPVTVLLAVSCLVLARRWEKDVASTDRALCTALGVLTLVGCAVLFAACGVTVLR
jgi:hypothetical protein